jgi:hypothetical protein
LRLTFLFSQAAGDLIALTKEVTAATFCVKVAAVS